MRKATRYIVLLLPFLAHTARAGELVGRVISVHDGDTLTVLVSRKQIRVRLLDIDGPERKQPFGTRSSRSARAVAGC